MYYYVVLVNKIHNKQAYRFSLDVSEWVRERASESCSSRWSLDSTWFSFDSFFVNRYRFFFLAPLKSRRDTHDSIPSFCMMKKQKNFFVYIVLRLLSLHVWGICDHVPKWTWAGQEINLMLSTRLGLQWFNEESKAKSMRVLLRTLWWMDEWMIFFSFLTDNSGKTPL